MNRYPLITALLLSTVLASLTEARGFRALKPLAPTATEFTGETNTAVEQLSRNVASQALEQVVSLWNTPDLQKALSERFFDASRLTDAVSENLPRDAVLRIQAIRDVQTLSQQQRNNPDTGAPEMVSIVSVTALTQLEFSSPTQGFVRRPGVNEFILEITQPAP